MPPGSKPALKETDLYPPVAAWLEASGWRVDAEVKDCDICARRGEELLIVELKTGVNFTLLAQAVERQRLTDLVYVAVPAGAFHRPGKARTNALRVFRRLELGVLGVTHDSPGKPGTGSVKILAQPEPFDREKSEQRAAGRKKALLGELSGRSSNRNQGGSTGTRIHTAYREAAETIAGLLLTHGPLSAKALRTLGSHPDKTYGILYDNHYGWFVREGKGVYGLSQAGREYVDSSEKSHHA